MNRTKYFTAGAALLALSAARSARATAFITEGTPPWARPTSAAQASNSLTTYQAWEGFDSSQTPGTPNSANDPASVNPSGTAYAWDNAWTTNTTDTVDANGTPPSDGAFFISNSGPSDIYSFSGVLNPQVTVPEYNVTGQQLNVVAVVQYYGSDILTTNGTSPDTGLPVNALQVTYTDASGVTQTVSAESLASYSGQFLSQSYSNFGEFGEADTADYQWTFTVPNTSNLQLSWGWGVFSSGLQDIAVDTQSVAATPEPAPIGLLGAASMLVLSRRRRA